MPIILPPSASQDALFNGITQALAGDGTLPLEPGTQVTRPGVNQDIAVGASGLRIGSTGPPLLPLPSKVTTAVIRRPMRCPRRRPTSTMPHQAHRRRQNHRVPKRGGRGAMRDRRADRPHRRLPPERRIEFGVGVPRFLSFPHIGKDEDHGRQPPCDVRH